MNEQNTVSGFSYYGSGYSSKILLPDAIVAVLDKESEMAKIKATEEKSKAELIALKEKAAKLSASHVKIMLPKKGKRDIEIFSRLELENIFANFDAMDSSTQHAGRKEHSHLLKNCGGFRAIPRVNPRAVLALANEFENMIEPIQYLAGELDLMSHLPIHNFNVAPMLLLGDPGIGKTAFALALSKVMGVPFKKLNGIEPSFSLTGSHPTWVRAAPGLVFKQLVLHACAAPLFLVDEVDKPSGERYPISLALLELLERKNAETFSDEYFQVTFDASYAMWILTANTLNGISEPLLSRMMVFNIPAPDVAQRKRIIKAEFNKLCRLTQAKIKIPPNELILLAERIDLDLRTVNRVVRDSVITALGKKSSIATIILPLAVKRSMGFI